MLIRDEQADEAEAIDRLTSDAFRTVPYSQGTEAAIIRALRRRGRLSLSLVAVDEDGLAGHVAFSPIAIDGVEDGWFGLGPISVRPDRQRQGIGRALITAGLDRLRSAGALGCALIGNAAVYAGSGFTSGGPLVYEGLDPAFVNWIVLNGASRSGALTFDEAFAATNEAG